jgi:SAM-dependent methyltransferase
MSSARLMEPEWLDELEVNDPRAIHSRRDLRRVNAWMFQARLMAQCLRRYPAGSSPTTIVELGCGDGTFMLQIAKRLAARWRETRLTLVDRQNLVSAQTRCDFATLGWTVETVTADVFAFLEAARSETADIVCANLFLHHFAASELRILLQGAARLTDFFAACEPRRGSLALTGSHLLWAIGCNDVSRHDAVASVRAGFAGAEISTAWADQEGWELREEARGLFTHCFVARRKSVENRDAL